MAVYEGCFTRLCNALAANNMYARTVGFIHPAGGGSAVGTAERLYDYGPLFPQYRHQGGVMLRATASTRVTIRYTSEADFVRKFRVACLITPLLALLTDNVHCTRGNPTITTAFIPTSGTMWTPTAAAFPQRDGFQFWL